MRSHWFIHRSSGFHIRASKTTSVQVYLGTAFQVYILIRTHEPEAQFVPWKWEQTNLRVYVKKVTLSTPSHDKNEHKLNVAWKRKRKHFDSIVTIFKEKWCLLGILYRTSKNEIHLLPPRKKFKLKFTYLPIVMGLWKHINGTTFGLRVLHCHCIRVLDLLRHLTSILTLLSNTS